jgi:ELWxxDGT repeat protein
LAFVKFGRNFVRDLRGNQSGKKALAFSARALESCGRQKWTMRRIWLLLLVVTLLNCSVLFALAALTPRLVKDFNTNTESTPFISIPFAVLDGVAYFQASDPLHGRELWRSDGTEAGTWMVVDLQPGPFDSSPGNIIVWNNQLFFGAAVGTNRAVLIKSDGTSNGTFIVASSFRGNSDTVLGGLAAVGNRLFFHGNDGVHHRELWTSDGTEEGTRMVKDINPGPVESLPLFITDVGGKAVFRAWSTNGNEIWASDGTAEGTILLKDIEPSGSSYPDSFTMLGTNLFFSARNGTELWKTDGTPEGTLFVARFGSASPSSSIQNMTRVGTQLFFQATVNGDAELWRSDGTSPGTVQVANIYTGGSSYPRDIADLNGIAIFSANVGTVRELWRSDGTSPGTWRVKNTNGIMVSSPFLMARFGDVVYFSSAATGLGSELWRTDGTSNATFLVKDIAAGSSSSFARVAAAMNGFALMTATTPEHGTELWRTDGTEAGTMLVKDINTRTASSTLETIGVGGETLFFSVGLSQLWKTRGTPDTTEHLHTFASVPGANRFVFPGIVYGDRLIFSGWENGTGGQLWVSDGTSNGTRLLKKIAPGAELAYPRDFRQVGTTLFFVAHGTNGVELWKTDGTESSTVEVGDLWPGAGGSWPTGLTEHEGALFFHASHASGRSGFWRSDGSRGGTVRLREFTNETFYGVRKAAGQLLFFMSENRTNTMLWASRGSAETTTPVGLVASRVSPAAQSLHYAARPDALLFTAGDTNTGVELWRTDGTAAGTGLVKDIRPGSLSSSITSMFGAGDLVYFVAYLETYGREIWRSDGTSDGTHLLEDIAPGTASSVSSYAWERMEALNGLAFFWPNESMHGTELWMTDGTEIGTRIVRDLNPLTQIPPSGSGAGVLDAVGNRLYFIGDDGLTGRELWVMDVPRQPTLMAAAQQGELIVESAGEPLQTRVLEKSDDLQNWTALSTNVAEGDGSIRMTNSAAGSYLFFRERAVIDAPR